MEILYFDDFGLAKNFIDKEKVQIFAEDKRIDSIGIGVDEKGYFIEGQKSPVERFRIKKKKFTGLRIVVMEAFHDFHGKPAPKAKTLPLIQPGLSINKGGVISTIVNYYGKECILSNKHVLDNSCGGILVHPKTGNAHVNKITFAKVIKLKNVDLDAGLAVLDPGVSFSPKVLGLGSAPVKIIDPVLGAQVIRYDHNVSREGTIKLVNVYTRKTGDQLFFEIQPNDNQNFTSNGDSGSLILSKDDPRSCIGIHKKVALRHQNRSDEISGSHSIPMNLIKQQIKFSLL